MPKIEIITSSAENWLTTEYFVCTQNWSRDRDFRLSLHVKDTCYMNIHFNYEKYVVHLLRLTQSVFRYDSRTQSTVTKFTVLSTLLVTICCHRKGQSSHSPQIEHNVDKHNIR